MRPAMKSSLTCAAISRAATSLSGLVSAQMRTGSRPKRRTALRDLLPTVYHLRFASSLCMFSPTRIKFALNEPARPLSAVISTTPTGAPGDAGLHERMIDRTDVGEQILQHLPERVGIRTRLLLQRLGTTDLRRGDLFHRLGDLLGVLHRPYPVAKIANARH